MIQQLKNQDAYDNSNSSESNQKPQKSLNQGMWDYEQIRKFMVFSSYNMNILASKLQRRTVKIFKEMSRFIGTRTSTQCRSQNQKLIKKHKNIKRIIRAYEAEIGKSEFEKAIMQYSEQLKSMHSLKKKAKQNKSKSYVSVFVQTQFPEDSSQLKDEAIKVEQQGIPAGDIQQKQISPIIYFPQFSNTFN